MQWTKPENYEFKEEASLLRADDNGVYETIEMTTDEKVYLVVKLLLKDYRSKQITEWNQKFHSVLTTEVTVLYNGKKVVQEMKYDSGHAPDGMTVQTIANSIDSSLGQTIRKKTDRDSIFNMPILEVVTPPSVMNIVQTHFFYIIGKFDN